MILFHQTLQSYIRRTNKIFLTIKASTVKIFPQFFIAILLFNIAVRADDSRPFDPTENPWNEIRKKRVELLLPDAMQRADIDSWIILCRENANDPLAMHVGCENAGARAAVMFFSSGAEVEAIAISPWGDHSGFQEAGIFDTVIVLQRGGSLWDSVVKELKQRAPQKIGVNSSSRPIADGLSYTLRRELETALGSDLSQRIVSAEEIVIEWLSVKLPEEIEILRKAAQITADLQYEAYAQVVPGESTEADVARYLKRRMQELGVEDAWAPAQNPAVNAGLDRGHAQPTDRIIGYGDIIQTDFGIKVYGIWCTDIQRFAYVLHPGENAPPPEVLQRWEHAREGSRRAFRAMKPGASGLDVDKAQREYMDTAGSLPVIWYTGHPVGYWAHDVGPMLGGADSRRTPSPDVYRPLRPGHIFAYDGFFCWETEEDGVKGTKTISVEEMAYVTDSGAEFLIPPQEDLILIRYKN
jgi:Xaa-Pro dipeptidase